MLVFGYFIVVFARIEHSVVGVLVYGSLVIVNYEGYDIVVVLYYSENLSNTELIAIESSYNTLEEAEGLYKDIEAIELVEFAKG